MQVLIIDPNTVSAESLYEKLRKITQIKCDFVRFENGFEALLEVEEGKIHPDVAFVDLSRRDGREDGIELSARLQHVRSGLQIIFTTDGGDFYPDVYEIDHAFLLRRPLDPSLLCKAWDRALSRIRSWESGSFVFEFNRVVYRIPYSEILYFENVSRRIVLHTADPDVSYHFYDVMSDVLPLLDHHFIRCHNSYIVNIARADTWSRSAFTIGGSKIPISRRYAEEAKKAFFSMTGKPAGGGFSVQK